MTSSSQNNSRPRAKKSLSQNFLQNQKIRDRIIAACELTKEDAVLEIGPGTGALTEELVSRAGHVYAVEKDKDLCRYLEHHIPGKRFTLIHGDILKFNLQPLPDRLIAVGNLPYQISTPIIEYLICNRNKIKKALITVQLEFARRLTAKPNSKEYGSLTCFREYYAEARILFKIKKTCFQPVPKVDSCFLCLEFRNPVERVRNEEFLFRLIQAAFQQRRKKIKNSLSRFWPAEEGCEKGLKDLGIDPDVRAENLRLSDYVRIIQKLER